jgi:nicotinate-nucleotide adenylyltransferase
VRTGIFGGTFDPPHLAHTMAVVWALESGEVDRVLVIPTARHAFGKEPLAGFDDRMAMCRLAMASLAPGLVEVNPVESERDAVSYMVDTVRLLAGRHPVDTFRLVIGSDIVADLPKWRESAALVRLAPPLVVPRIVPGSAEFGPRPGALPMMSSSEVRRLLASGAPAAGMVPARVLDYMRAGGLYSVTGESSGGNE